MSLLSVGNVFYPYGFFVLSQCLTAMIQHIPWTICFLWLKSVGLYLYVIQNAEDCKRIQKRVGRWCTHSTEDHRGFGYAIGRWYILSITLDRSEYGNYYDVWMIATRASFERLMEKSVREENEPGVSSSLEEDASSTSTLAAAEPAVQATSTLQIARRSGSYFNPFYRVRDITLRLPTPWRGQDIIVNDVLEVYRRQRHASTYIHGHPGTGKSTIGLLLAQKIRGVYYNHFRPWEPNESLATVYNEIDPSEDRPLVLAMDEIDEAITLMDQHLIPRNNKLPIAITDRNGWNTMLDEIGMGLYPYTIVVCTSNTPPDRLPDLSYVRAGRIDRIFPLDKTTKCL